MPQIINMCDLKKKQKENTGPSLDMNGEPWVDKSEEHNLHQEHNLKVQET
jgi:hypothetical protein